MSTFQLPFEAPKLAPISPPTSAWVELEGMPNHQVSRFQMMPASIAQNTVRVVTATTLSSTIPLWIVFATAWPKNAPTRFMLAARSSAWRGVSTLVDTTVAMAFAVS